MRRVVVTGVGGITALGEDWPTIRARMLKGETAVRTMTEWDRFSGINTRLGAPVLGDVGDQHEAAPHRAAGTEVRQQVDLGVAMIAAG